MAHCPVELLDDVGDLLAEVRAWQGVVEKTPGVFWVGRQPLLHFHLFEGRHRRADVRASTGWIQVDLPRPLSATRRRRLLGVLRRCHREKLRR